MQEHTLSGYFHLGRKEKRKEEGDETQVFICIACDSGTATHIHTLLYRSVHTYATRWSLDR